MHKRKLKFTSRERAREASRKRIAGMRRLTSMQRAASLSFFVETKPEWLPPFAHGEAPHNAGHSHS